MQFLQYLELFQFIELQESVPDTISLHDYALEFFLYDNVCVGIVYYKKIIYIKNVSKHILPILPHQGRYSTQPLTVMSEKHGNALIAEKVWMINVHLPC